MNGRLLYHKTKSATSRNGLVKTTVLRNEKEINAYSDDFSGNQDPYIWQKVFLHTYCHMGQMRDGFQCKPKGHPEVDRGDILFWITSDVRGNYTQLKCDLVFVVAEKQYWSLPNQINRHDSPANTDSEDAFKEHYAWVEQHKLSDKMVAQGFRRFTLKADPAQSFQPQDANGNLLDIRPLLKRLNVNLTALNKDLGPSEPGRFARPFLLEEQKARALYTMIRKSTFAPIQLTGDDFAQPDFERERKRGRKKSTP
ncbi:hypothetical protein KSF_108290 [Reticulibacter mediterranei]|uniref:Uncharacterized protein n=1 Tax=Reticulibacter mediterranei TaxID=2778369 RepID=A0A8J3ITZ3_9CHLR|nr:hypothetical protein [Reticulibacter mediterranei]GHP00782.1 hypothetical protein KSF_108290 [Reticulibacter mediterranei]